jgi:MFS transporter, putative metabolite:H+ symporter
MGSKAPGNTLSNRIDLLPVKGWHWIMLTVCLLAVMFENYNQVSIAMAMPAILMQWKLPMFNIGVLLSASSLGLLIGAIVFGIVTDIIGRKLSFILTTLIFSLFVGLGALANDFNTLYWLRVLAGLGLGGFIPVGMAYVSEYSPLPVRGRFLGIFSIGNGIGYCLTVIASMFLIPGSADGWRYTFAIGGLGILLLIPVYLFLPESVRWLQTRGKVDEAVKIVEDLEQKIVGQVTVPHAEALAGAKEQVAQQKANAKKTSIADFFKGDLFKATILGSVLMLAANYTFYGFIQWMPTFLTQNLKLELTSGYWFTLIAAAFGTGTPGLLVGWMSDKIGRRWTMSIMMGLYAIAGFLFLAVIGWSILLLYWFSSAMSSVLYIYVPELFPTRLRGTGLGIAGGVGRLAGFIAPMLIGLSVAASGLAGVITVNAIILVVSILIIWIIGIETKTVKA